MEKRSNTLTKRVLHLPLDFKWYDKIVYDGKREEYREDKPYWRKRLLPFIGPVREGGYTHVEFRRGYTKVTREYPLVDIHFGEGKPEWGGVPGKTVFVLAFRDAEEKDN